LCGHQAPQHQVQWFLIGNLERQGLLRLTLKTHIQLEILLMQQELQILFS
jgi:hypothetical protein